MLKHFKVLLMNDALQSYINTHSKSQIVGFLLSLVFGPLGLFYSNWILGLILSAIAIATFASIVGPVLCWVLAILSSFFTVRNYNKKVRATANLNHSGSVS